MPPFSLSPKAWAAFKTTSLRFVASRTWMSKRRKIISTICFYAIHIIPIRILFRILLDKDISSADVWWSLGLFLLASNIQEWVLSYELLEKRDYEDEMGAAGRVQRALLPSELPSGGGVTFAAHLQSAQDVGGDYYDMIPLTENRYAVAVADVSGKGVPAALLMTSLRALLRSFMRSELPLEQLVTRINDAVYVDSESGQYATLFCGILDVDKMTLDYCNAGHVTPYLVSSSGDLRGLDAGGPPVGMLSPVTYSEGSELLSKGDRLVAYTDGVSDVGGPPGSSLSQEDLERLVLELRKEDPDKMVAVIRDAVRDLEARNEWPDDVTVLVAAM